MIIPSGGGRGSLMSRCSIILSTTRKDANMQVFPCRLLPKHTNNTNCCFYNYNYYYCGTIRQGRRPFSSTRFPPPKLSRRGKVDLFLVVAGAVGTFLYIQNSNDWEQDVWEVQQRLLESTTTATTTTTTEPSERSDSRVNDSGQTIMEEDLPLPLETFLKLVSSSSSPGDDVEEEEEKYNNTVVVEQSGEFWASQQWYPFRMANLLITASDPPGFVWEVHVEILKMPNRILEWYVGGKGSIMTKAWGKIPMIQVEEDEPYVLFWLAMAPLCPDGASFRRRRRPLSERTSNSQIEKKSLRIEWNSIHDLSSCSGELIDEFDDDNNTTYHLELFFDHDTKLLKSARVTSECLPKPWQVNYGEYQKDKNDGCLYPSFVEVGKWTSGQQFDLHMKIQNHRVQKALRTL
eukprot:scaffold10345_cov158-Cylindrotheca_fusiformis.AAC.4